LASEVTADSCDGAVTAVLVDCDDAIADKLSRMLRSELGVRVLAIAGTIEAGVAACVWHRPSLLFIDTDLRSACGLPILDVLATASPATAVFMVSGRSPCISCPFTMGLEMRIAVRLSKDLPSDKLLATVWDALNRIVAFGKQPAAGPRAIRR
jgi:DNA-binding NarL/FixJ family response regulator